MAEVQPTQPAPATPPTTPAPATESAPKKKGVCSKVYVDGEGNETRSATPGAVALEFRFNNAEKTVHRVTIKDHNAEIVTCLSWFGISEKYGNSYAGSKGDADDALEKFLSMQEQLVGGTWVEKADGVGPRPSLIGDAIIAALKAKGETVDDSRAASIREKVKDKTTREGALKDPAIKAEFEKAKAERAVARAKKAAEAAANVTIEVEGF